MFPRLFQRFFAARDDRAIGRTMLLYPLVCTVLFFFPISIGVMRHLAFPDLVGKGADKILPMLLTSISGDFMASLVLAAGMAALMSTMDSQLLTLSSIFTRDILPVVGGTQSETSIVGRLAVVVLSLAGLALAYKPPATILQIATQTFTGLAVLFPTVIFGLYLKKVYAPAAIGSILVGEGTLVLFYLKLLPSGPFLPVVWVMLVTVGVYLSLHAVFTARSGELTWTLPGGVINRYLWLYGALFILSLDFWAWGKAQPLFFGVPYWISYFLVLSLLQTIAMVLMLNGQDALYTEGVEPGQVPDGAHP
jgi:SSS family solute:Na+ symporter